MTVARWKICLGLNYLHNRCLNFSVDSALVTTAIPRAAAAAETRYATQYQSNCYSCGNYHRNDNAESGFQRKLFSVATIGALVGYIVAAVRLVLRIYDWTRALDKRLLPKIAFAKGTVHSVNVSRVQANQQECSREARHFDVLGFSGFGRALGGRLRCAVPKDHDRTDSPAHHHHHHQPLTTSQRGEIGEDPQTTTDNNLYRACDITR